MGTLSYRGSYTNIFIFVIVLTLYSCVSLNVFNIVYDAQPKPYLDEVFHVPQAIKYCNGTFHEWDPKITTLPGLYLLSIGILKPLSWIFRHELCTLYGLRFINLLCSISNFAVICSIRSFILKHEKKQRWKAIVGSFNIASFPVLYFFTFLYYTDSISTLLNLLMYRLFLDQSFYLSAFIGLISVICRQTNIVWVVFLGLEVGFEALQNHISKLQKKKDMADNWKALLFSILKKPKLHLPLIKELLRKETGFIFVASSFLFFVWKNKGIVVGDRLAHQAVINLPQLFYFYIFVAFFCSPYALLSIKKCSKFVYKHPSFLSATIALCVFIVALNTQVHPYLLADNRHYTFYLWRRFYERHWTVRYLLIPAYIFGAYCIHFFIYHKKNSFKISFYICLVVSLIPQKLLEFRYFILPFLLMRLNMKTEAWWQLLLEFCVYSVINVSTIYLFITKTFYWEDSPDVQRIMW